jgi:DNA-nicking Smr family endonuclease
VPTVRMHRGDRRGSARRQSRERAPRMTKARRPPRKHHLSEEDEELWAAVSKSVDRVRKRDRVHHALDDIRAERAARRHTERHSASDEGSEASHARPNAIRSPAKPKPSPQPSPPAVAELDRRRVRRLTSGRIEIEARLDLHGMYQSEAHARLRAFLHGCYSRGLRHVLVVTGKGVAIDHHRPFELEDRRDRGVLRRNVPLWLSEPELRTIVVSFTTAHARHGGEGALYVQLRNLERVKRRSG